LELVKPRGVRDYRGAVARLDGAEVAFLSASEIAQQLAAGAVHFGITGEDLVREMIPAADAKVVLIDALEHDRRLRVATKYINLTRGFFSGHGIVDYRIVESAGATEGAPAAGTAELIVDITTTGATLAANGLKVLDDGVILRSQANLVASREADWNKAPRE